MSGSNSDEQNSNERKGTIFFKVINRRINRIRIGPLTRFMMSIILLLLLFSIGAYSIAIYEITLQNNPISGIWDWRFGQVLAMVLAVIDVIRMLKKLILEKLIIIVIIYTFYIKKNILENNGENYFV
jgi:hypothetical protein